MGYSGSTREYFYELQQFRQWWLWALLLLTTIGLFLYNGHAFYSQIIRGIPAGNEPMSDNGLILYVICSTIFMVLVILLFWRVTLEVKVDRMGIHYRYFPLIPSWKTIRPEDIIEWKVASYFPTGYGIRRGFRSTTINVSGNNGLKLALRDRRGLRLGTQRPDELRAAIERLMNKEEA